MLMEMVLKIDSRLAALESRIEEVARRTTTSNQALEHEVKQVSRSLLTIQVKTQLPIVSIILGSVACLLALIAIVLAL